MKIDKSKIGPSIVFVGLILILVGFFMKSYGQDYPEPVGYVNDFADVLTDGEERILEAILIGYEKQSTIEIVVVTIKSLDGQSVEEYTNELAQKWGVGKKGEDNGLMILNSTGDRKWRIEVGYGLEEYMTDAYSKNIGDNYLTPNLKDGNYLGAYTQTVEQIMKKLGNLTDEDKERLKEEKKSEESSWPDWPWWVYLIIAVIFLWIFGFDGIFILFALATGGDSSSDGFSGGTFGGGGASG